MKQKLEWFLLNLIKLAFPEKDTFSDLKVDKIATRPALKKLGLYFILIKLYYSYL